MYQKKKRKTVQVIGVGNSDHLGIVVRKFSKFPVSKPQSVRKRNYKDFNKEKFLTDINTSDLNSIVTGAEMIESAADAFKNILRSILNHHAPMKTFHMRRNYNPHISEDTKDLIRNRNAVQEEATRTKSKILGKEFNLL